MSTHLVSIIITIIITIVIIIIIIIIIIIMTGETSHLNQCISITVQTL